MHRATLIFLKALQYTSGMITIPSSLFKEAARFIQSTYKCKVLLPQLQSLKTDALQSVQVSPSLCSHINHAIYRHGFCMRTHMPKSSMNACTHTFTPVNSTPPPMLLTEAEQSSVQHSSHVTARLCQAGRGAKSGKTLPDGYTQSSDAPFSSALPEAKPETRFLALLYALDKPSLAWSTAAPATSLALLNTSCTIGIVC